MGCRHYFVADWLEELVGEGDSRSSSRGSRTWKFFGLFHNCMWQSRHPEVDVYFLTLCEQIDRLLSTNGSLHFDSICIYVFVCVFVFIWTFNRHIGTLAAKWETCVDFLSTRTGTFVLSQQVALFCELDLGLVVLVGSSLLVEQLLNPILSSNYFSRKSSAAAEVTHILFRVWFLQFPSW